MVTRPTLVSPLPSASPAQHSRAWLVVRWIGAALLAAVAALAIPLTVVAGWVKGTVLDTTAFTAAMAPLAEQPRFQNAVADAAGQQVGSIVDESGAMSALQTVTGGISGILDWLPGTSDAGTTVDEFPQTLTDEIASTTTAQTLKFTQSSAFPPLWSSAVGEIHPQLVEILSNATPASNTATVSVAVGPLISSVRDYLEDDGQWWARFIPTVNTDVQVLELSDVSSLQSFYRLGSEAYVWLLIASIVAGVGALALAPRRLLVLGGGALGTSLVSVYLARAIPGFGEAHFNVGADATVNALSSDAWSLLSDPLLSSVTTLSWVTIGVSVVALVAALVVYLRRARAND